MGKHYFHSLFLSVILPVFLYNTVTAQNKRVIDSLKNVLKTQKDDSNKVITLNKISNALENMGSYDSSLSYAGRAQRLAEKINFKRGLARAFVCTGNNYIDKGDYSKALEYQNKALKISQEIGNKRGIAAANCNIGNIYLDEGNCPKALEYANSGLSLTQELGDTNGVAIQLGNIGNIYSELGSFSKSLDYYFKALVITQKIGDKEGTAINMGNIGSDYHALLNYPKALEYFLKAVSIHQETGNKDGVATSYGNIGSVYLDLGDKTKALEYYFKALPILQEAGDKDAIAYNLSNIGDACYLEKNYPKSLEYNYKGLLIAREMGDKTLIGTIHTSLGRTYTQQKNYTLAKITLDSAITLLQNIEEKNHLQAAYSAMVVLDSSMGNYKAEAEDYKKYIIYRDSVTNTESVKKITQLEMSYEFQKKEDSVKVLQEKTDIIKSAEIKRKTITAYGLAIILILIIISSALLINRQQIKHKKNKIILEKEKQHVESELVSAKKALEEYTHSMVEKNKLLEEFKSEVDELKLLKSKEIDDKRVEHLQHLNSATILTDEDWDKFKTLFEQVYKGFFVRLKEKLPDLTQAEIRLICLTKLQMETKEMAGVLAVSLDTIKKSRHRLRKKLGLSEEDTIDDIVESI